MWTSWRKSLLANLWTVDKLFLIGECKFFGHCTCQLWHSFQNFFCMWKCWIFCQVPQSSGNFSVPLRNKVDCVPAVSKASNISSWQSAVCSLSNHICSDKLWWTGYLKFRYWILFFATIMVWFQHACQHYVCSISILSSFCCGKLHFNSDIQSKTWF